MIEPPCLQAIHTPDLAAINRCINGAFPLMNRPIPMALEGVDGYDCKGFTRLKAEALHARGIPYEAMTVLGVDNGTRTSFHVVLQIGAVVLGNLSPRTAKPSDYRVLHAWTVREAYGIGLD